MCFFSRRRFQQQQERQVAELKQQATAAAAQAEAVAAGSALPAPRRCRRPSDPAAAATPSVDPLRAPLLQPICEDDTEAEPGAPPRVQSHDELPSCVNMFLGRAIRDGRTFKLFTLNHLGRMKLDVNGSWKEATATQYACPLEPAFVWSTTASLAPLVPIKGCDSFVEGEGHCAWHLWGAVPTATGSGREVDQSLLVRWLAEAVCFPQALQPSTFLRWEPVKGQNNEAVAVLTYGGLTVRATFLFDSFARAVRVTTHDFLRRLPSGAFEQGEWTVSYSGHMLFGLSPQGDVMQEELATYAGVFIPTNMEATWQLPDGSRWQYAQLTVGRVVADC